MQLFCFLSEYDSEEFANCRQRFVDFLKQKKSANNRIILWRATDSTTIVVESVSHSLFECRRVFDAGELNRTQ